MEEACIEAPKLVESKLLFPPHRRLSKTYHTLVRILSPFCENGNVSLATEFDPQQLRAAYSSHMRQVTIESSCQQVVEDSVRVETGDSATEKVTVVEDGLGRNTLEDKRVHDSEVMDFMKDMVIVERSDNVSDQRRTFEARSEDNDCVHEGNHTNEVEAEHIVEGNKVLVDDNSCSNTRTSNQTNGGNDQISPTKIPEEIVEHPQVMEEEDDASIVQKLSGIVVLIDGHMVKEASKKEDNQENVPSILDKDMQQSSENCAKELKSESIVCKTDLEMEKSYVSSIEVMVEDNKEQCRENVSGADPSYMEKEIPCGAYEQSKNGGDKVITVDVDASKVEHKMLLEAMKVDDYMIENGEIEEGEICGDSTNEISEDPVVLTEKVDGIQISEERMNRSKLPLIQANGEANKHVSLCLDKAVYASHENREESKSKQNKSSMDSCRHRSIVSEKMVISTNEDQNGFMLEERGYTGKNNGSKKDVDSFTAHFSNQVLCSQVPKEHANGRKEIVSVEKETGACNKKKRGPGSEGRKERKKIQKRKKRAEKNRKDGVKRLKLHTVTVPKPVVYCRHYIKGRCQEGDKCKFSHDTTPLTKSTPCSYFARHSCMKGGDCPFDHQLFKYPCSNFVSNGSCPRGDTCMFSHKMLPQLQESTSMPNLKTESKPPVIPDSLDTQKQLNISGRLKQSLVTVPNAIGASCNRTPLGGTLLKKMTGPPPVGINFLSFGKSPDSSSQMKNGNGECRNVLAQSGLSSVENSNEISRKIQPNTAPKGINFLSFGRTSLQSDHENLATPPSYNRGSIPSGNQIQAVSKTGHGSNELLKKVQMTTPKQTNFSSPVGNYASNELVSSSSNLKAGTDLFVQKKGSVCDQHEGLSAVLSRLSGTPSSSGQFSDGLASSMTKGTPKSAQKALLSTLAFAAKHDSFMNKGKSSAFPALGNEGNKEGGNGNMRGSLKNDQAKASKLLDLLLGIGSKSNL
ncbi:uncharacterized protein LOC120086002 [Benincasa hispida]|uniref:uncharacterized protein LOC120086002 n=1 Tax=Benincasa hispida TaxID=102211 RepID=UPI0019026341|nr:uncharacterized protein LOC120086002 [Benincasa hispida]